MTQKQRDEILLELKSKSNEHDEQLKFIHSKLAEHDKQFEFIYSKLAEHDKQFEFIHSKLDEHDKQFESINSLLAEHSKQLESLSRSVAIIEFDHGKKIQTLLDVTSGILEKLDSFEKYFESNNKTLDNHSSRIWNLESKVGIV